MSILDSFVPVGVAFATVLVAGACSLPNKNDNTFFIATGVCSGQPATCPGLSGADCAKVAGCQDTGTCTGTATNIGESCGAQTSFATCTNTLGCFWQANCIGEVLGTCSAVTEQGCTAVPGCVWTPFVGTGGAASVRDR